MEYRIVESELQDGISYSIREVDGDHPDGWHCCSPRTRSIDKLYSVLQQMMKAFGRPTVNEGEAAKKWNAENEYLRQF